MEFTEDMLNPASQDYIEAKRMIIESVSILFCEQHALCSHISDFSWNFAFFSKK